MNCTTVCADSLVSDYVDVHFLVSYLRITLF